MKQIVMILVGCAFINSFSSKVQEADNTKVILITLDGLRWQELFTAPIRF